MVKVLNFSLDNLRSGSGQSLILFNFKLNMHKIQIRL
jgi:hypothetical protein